MMIQFSNRFEEDITENHQAKCVFNIREEKRLLLSSLPSQVVQHETNVLVDIIENIKYFLILCVLEGSYVRLSSLDECSNEIDCFLFVVGSRHV